MMMGKLIPFPCRLRPVAVVLPGFIPGALGYPASHPACIL